MCFTLVKPFISRFGRVLVQDILMLCLWVDAFEVLFAEFDGLVGSQGRPRGPNGSLLGALRDQIGAKLVILVAP